MFPKRKNGAVFADSNTVSVQIDTNTMQHSTIVDRVQHGTEGIVRFVMCRYRRVFFKVENWPSSRDENRLSFLDFFSSRETDDVHPHPDRRQLASNITGAKLGHLCQNGRNL